jgi:hypothetical protein
MLLEQYCLPGSSYPTAVELDPLLVQKCGLNSRMKWFTCALVE